MSGYFQAHIERMAGYQPGEQPRGPGFIKLNTNENPYPPSPKVAQAIAIVLGEGLRKYPDPVGTDLAKVQPLLPRRRQNTDRQHEEQDRCLRRDI